MEGDYKEKVCYRDEFDEMAKDVQEIKTTNRFTLKRLNQLLNCDRGKCPVCGCECATDGYAVAMHELELKVEDLEKVHNEREALLFRVLKQLRGVQKRLQCMISDIPENLQEVLGSLFTILKPFLNDGTDDKVVANRESSIKEGYSEDNLMGSEILRSERSDSEEESSNINDFKDEIRETSITLSKTKPSQTAECASESENLDRFKHFLSVTVNTVQESKYTVQSLKPETEQITKHVSVIHKETSTQTDDPIVQTSLSISTTDEQHAHSSYSKSTTPSAVATQKSPSTSRSDLVVHTEQQNKSAASKLPEMVFQTERKEVLDITWHMLGSEELSKAKALGLQDVTGARTVLCLDISASMTENDAWSQAKRFLDEFLGGVEDMKVEYRDNIALSTFGHNTGICQRLTKELSDIRKALESIKFGGPSPMYGGLMLAVAALAVPEGIPVPMPVHPRIILVTDGHCTGTNIIAGPDKLCDAEEQAQAKSQLIELSQKFEGNHINFICVPVGESDQEFLGLLAATGDGKVVSYKDGRKLAEETLQRLKTVTSISGDSIAGLHGAIGGMLPGGVSLSDLLSGKLSRHLLRGLPTQRDDYYLERDNENLPKIGSRVRRGPDWQWREQDSYGPGTVIGHAIEHMSAWVEWDANGQVNIYRYGDGGAFDLLLVEEPRILSKFEAIAVGCIVKKGPGWKSYIGEDGPAERGVVVRKQPDNKVTVYWDYKKRGTYKWDGSSNGEIVVCDPMEKTFQGSGHVLGGGPEFEARQRQKEHDQAERSHQRQHKAVKNKNKNIVS